MAELINCRLSQMSIESDVYRVRPILLRSKYKQMQLLCVKNFQTVW
jgi:hypothetical protein